MGHLCRLGKSLRIGSQTDPNFASVATKYEDLGADQNKKKKNKKKKKKKKKKEKKKKKKKKTRHFNRYDFASSYYDNWPYLYVSEN